MKIRGCIWELIVWLKKFKRLIRLCLKKTSRSWIKRNKFKSIVELSRNLQSRRKRKIPLCSQITIKWLLKSNRSMKSKISSFQLITHLTMMLSLWIEGSWPHRFKHSSYKIGTSIWTWHNNKDRMSRPHKRTLNLQTMYQDKELSTISVILYGQIQ